MTTALAGLPGQVLLPDSPGYEAARKPAMARYYGVRPAAIVLCESASEVASVLEYARRTGTHVVPRSGGHCFAGRSSTSGIVLDVSRMSSVVLEDGVATVGAGVRLTTLYDVLDAAGVTIPAGCGPTVGIAGLTLGGGIGLLGRSHGLTCDNLLAAEVVLADGQIVMCSPNQYNDLYWALRGAGGGQFGIVTQLVFSTLPSPVATRFHLTWSREDAAAVIDAWQQWAPHAPDELNANLRVTAAEVHLFGLTDGEFAAPVGIPPKSASVERMPYRRLKQSFVGLGAPPDGVDHVELSKSEFFARPIPHDAIEALLCTFSGELNLTPMGGAYNRVPTDATAFAHRNESFLLELVGTAPLPPITADIPHTERTLRNGLNQSFATITPWASGHVYPNFPDLTLTDPLTAYHGPNLPRLRQTKHTYDPTGLFHFPHSL